MHPTGMLEKALQAVSREIHSEKIFENFITFVFMEHEEIIAAIHAKKLDRNRSELISPLQQFMYTFQLPHSPCMWHILTCFHLSRFKDSISKSSGQSICGTSENTYDTSGEIKIGQTSNDANLTHLLLSPCTPTVSPSSTSWPSIGSHIGLL